MEQPDQYSDPYSDGAETQMYRVRIRSHLSPDWSAMPGVVTLALGYDDQGHPITTLLLEVADRSALMGILNEMHGVNLPLVAMEYVENLPTDGR